MLVPLFHNFLPFVYLLFFSNHTLFIAENIFICDTNGHRWCKYECWHNTNLENGNNNKLKVEWTKLDINNGDNDDDDDEKEMKVNFNITIIMISMKYV